MNQRGGSREREVYLHVAINTAAPINKVHCQVVT